MQTRYKFFLMDRDQKATRILIILIYAENCFKIKTIRIHWLYEQSQKVLTRKEKVRKAHFQTPLS